MECLRPELAAARGEVRPIVEHLRSGQWCTNVILTLSCYLRAAGTPRWHLVFTTRNGRPSLTPGVIWHRGNERIIGERLFVICQNPAMQDVQFLHELADALDPEGNTKWKLVFRRPNQRGRPSDRPLRKLLELSVLGHRAYDLHDELGTWKSVHTKLGHPQNPHEPSNRLKAAKRLVRPERKPS